MDELGKIKLYNADCMEVMAKYPDKYFDLAVVDPPYGINISNRVGSIGQKKGQGRLTKYTRKNWDNSIPSDNYFKELFRVSKNQIIFGGNYFAPFLPPAKGWIVWDKKQPFGVSFAMAELAYTSYDISTKVYSCSRALIGNKVSNNDRIAQRFIKIHPTQKPIQLYEWVFNNYANKTDKVLDTHLGSGSSAVAAHNYGLDFTGVEIDEEYYTAAKKRLIQRQNELDLSF